jgi:hypothetical protein
MSMKGRREEERQQDLEKMKSKRIGERIFREIKICET